jgi:hypothetical protein
MPKTILTGVAVRAIGGAAAGTMIANAQPAPPARTERPPEQMRRLDDSHGREDRRLTFALIYPQADRQLTPPDVQNIAEAFLLLRGNHSWKVVDVAPSSDGAIGFALATQEGSVIAHFTIDSRTGRVTRTG